MRGRRAIAAAMVMVAALAGGAAFGADLPRLAGLVIAPEGRVALFEAGDGTLSEARAGDEVAGFRVLSVDRDGVRLQRGAVATLVRTTPAGTPPAPIDTGGVTFGLMLRPQPPVDD